MVCDIDTKGLLPKIPFTLYLKVASYDMFDCTCPAVVPLWFSKFGGQSKVSNHFLDDLTSQLGWEISSNVSDSMRNDYSQTYGQPNFESEIVKYTSNGTTFFERPHFSGIYGNVIARFIIIGLVFIARFSYVQYNVIYKHRARRLNPQKVQEESLIISNIF